PSLVVRQMPPRRHGEEDPQTRRPPRGHHCLGPEALRRRKSRPPRHLRGRTQGQEGKETDLPPPLTTTHKTAHASITHAIDGHPMRPQSGHSAADDHTRPAHSQTPPTQPSRAVPRPSTPPAAPPHRPNADRQRPSSPQIHHPAPA